MKKFLVAICLLISILVGIQVEAQTVSADSSANTGSTSTATVPKQKNKKLFWEADLSYTSNFKSTEETDAKASTDLTITTVVKLSKNYSGTVMLPLYIDHSAQNDTGIGVSRISLSHTPWKLTVNDKLKPTIFGDLLPTATAAPSDSYRGGTGVSLSFVHSYSILKKEGDLTVAISALKNFHEYERGASDKANLSHRVRSHLMLNQNVTKKLSFELAGFYQVGWTYQSALRTKFFTAESVALAVAENAKIYVAHTNEGDALQANGTDSNVSVYDDNSSYFSAGIAMKF